MLNIIQHLELNSSIKNQTSATGYAIDSKII